MNRARKSKSKKKGDYVSIRLWITLSVNGYKQFEISKVYIL